MLIHFLFNLFRINLQQQYIIAKIAHYLSEVYKLKAIQIVTTLFIGLFLCVCNVYAGDAAAILNQYWKNVNHTGCASSDPDYYCSGVIAHVFDDESFLHSSSTYPWMPNQAGITKGSVSFSYLRQDIPVNEPLYMSDVSKAGYIFAPIASLASSQQYTLFCDYPLNAFTDKRIDKGCGHKIIFTNTTDLSTCKKALVFTSDQYVRRAHNPKTMCSASPDQAGFKMMLDTIKKLTIKIPKMYWNELVIEEWHTRDSKDVPIEAFFYEVINNVPQGKNAADSAAQSYHEVTGIDVPVVAVDINKLALGDDAPFSNETP